MCKTRFVALFLFLSFCPFFLLFPSRNVSKWLPFLERPEEYITKRGASLYQKSYFYPAFFITTASTAFRRRGGNAGIPELWGGYDLKSVITGLAAVKATQGQTYNPFIDEVGYTDWNQKELKFRIDGKIKTQGIILSLEQNLFKSDFSLGAFLPVMHGNTTMRYLYDSDKSHIDAREVTDSEVAMLDRVRRKVHCDLGLKGATWAKTGLGDLDVHLRWRRYWDHQYKMRGIDFNLQTGVLIPTGVKRDENYPSSIPFGGNGNWGWYGDLVTELELKPNWRFGFMGGIMYQFKKNHAAMRIPYHSEPPIFSALVGNVEINPGITLKASPYFMLENIMGGLHFQFRYTYLRHSPDKLKDKRSCKQVASYLESCLELSNAVRLSRKNLSRWTSHYLTLQTIYDSVEAMKNWLFKPKFYALFDYAFTGRGMCKTHQFTLGVELHF